MHLHKLQQLFTAAIITTCFTFAVPSVNAQHDLSKVTTYEALLDTFMAYPDSPAVRQQCLQAMEHLKNSAKISPLGHETTITTLISLGLHDTRLRVEALDQIVAFQLHNYEDTIFTFLNPGSNDYFWALTSIGGRRTSEFFKEILQRYTFDEYELKTMCALRDMKDSAIYLIPEFKKYSDTIQQYYLYCCMPLQEAICGYGYCMMLSPYRILAEHAVLYLEELKRNNAIVATQPSAYSPVNPLLKNPSQQIPGSVYTPNGKLVTGALTAGGVYIKDRKIFIHQGAAK